MNKMWLIAIIFLSACGSSGSSSSGSQPSTLDPNIAWVKASYSNASETTKKDFAFVARNIEKGMNRYLKPRDIPGIRAINMHSGIDTHIWNGVFTIGTQNRKWIDPLDWAAILVHEQCHIDDNYRCTQAAENMCTDVQIDFLRKHNASSKIINHYHGTKNTGFCR